MCGKIQLNKYLLQKFYDSQPNAPTGRALIFSKIPSPEAGPATLCLARRRCALSHTDTQSGRLWIFSGGLRAGFRRTARGRKEPENSGEKSAAVGGMADRDPVPLPAEVRAKLAELELELSEGE